MKARFEAALIRIAAWLLDRNIKRSMVVSRQDNNWIFDAVFQLRGIARRIERGYEGQHQPGGR